jgi:hypothetical protein
VSIDIYSGWLTDRRPKLAGTTADEAKLTAWYPHAEPPIGAASRLISSAIRTVQIEHSVLALCVRQRRCGVQPSGKRPGLSAP